MSSSATPINQILAQLPARDRQAVLAGSQSIVLRGGRTLVSANEPVVSVFFPISGVVAYVSEMTTGREVSFATVGREGIVAAPAMGMGRHPYRIAAVLDCEGYKVRIDALWRAFNELERFREAVLADIGRQWSELASLAACFRVHSHRQRVARCLLMMLDKSHEPFLVLTHEDIARMVGGARHGVTTVLNALHREGAITHVRGRIDVADRALLVREACECYLRSAELVG